MALTTAHLRNLGYQGIRSSSALTVHLQQKHFSTKAEIAKSTSTAVQRRGTGGRSSFNGIVATVFGNSGCLGKAVVHQLGKIGTQLILPHRSDLYDVLRLKLVGDLGQVLFFPFHLKDEESLYKAMKYSNVVINLIGRYNQTSNFSYEDVHVTGARNIARIAKECGVKRLIHVSALGATEHPKPVVLKTGSAILSSKWRGEQAVREEFPEATIFRPSTMWGEQDTFLNFYASRWRYGWDHSGLPLLNKGKGIYRMPVFMSDVAKGITNAIFDNNSIGQTYEAVGPRRYELCEIIDWFHRVMIKDEFGYRVTELRRSPVFHLKVWILETFFWKKPRICWEKIELDHITDVLTPGLPTLEDLGVQLTPMEVGIPTELRRYRAISSYNDALGEFTPAPPKVAPEPAD